MSPESSWLIELGYLHPTWWTGHGDEFTNDAQKALRFARHRDAVIGIGFIQNQKLRCGCKPIEHLYHGGD